MAKYLCKVSYSVEGAQGLIKDGGTARRTAVDQLLQSIGGKVESFYFALGDEDGYLICDIPDEISAAALSIRVAAIGGARVKTVQLLTPAQIDQAVKKSVTYRAPGK
ncbi:MAG: GYD domain-containing protein [Planctomycetota bacterium]